MAIITLSKSVKVRFSVTIAEMRFSPPSPHSSISVTLSVNTATPSRRISFLRARTISVALSETGKTLFPRSVFSGTPSRSEKKAFVLSLSKRRIAEKRNFPFAVIFPINSSGVQSFVRLHLPLPVMPSLRPRRAFRSKTVTAAPLSAAKTAALIPAAPAPIMAIFRIYFSPFSLFCERKSSASAIISKAAFIFSSISAVFAAISERRM